METQLPSGGRAARSGALSGALTALGFAALHHLLISDIWFSLVPMMAAGAICGACLGWSYTVLFERASARSWLTYNLVYVALFVLLGAGSFAVYEPITTVAALLTGGEPPPELMWEAAPLTLAFTLVSATVIALLWGRTLGRFAAALLTTTILVLLFGLNVSVIGLVQMSGEGVSLLALFFALIVVILLGNAGIFLALERNRTFGDRPERRPPLLLRPWAESDAPALREAIDEDLGHLRPWLSWTLEEPGTLERTRARLRRHVEEFSSGEVLRYAITAVDRPSRVLGGAHLSRRAGEAERVLGYWVRKSATRQGMAAAAAAALVAHAFAEEGVERVLVQCDVANAASAAFARALGFQPLGRRTTTYPDGTPRPVLEFEMTRESYGHHAASLRDRARRVRLAADGVAAEAAFESSAAGTVTHAGRTS